MNSDTNKKIDWILIENQIGFNEVRIAQNFIKWAEEINYNPPNNFTPRFLNGEPIQYILGVGFFHKYHFKLNTSTLIPRPETEELVELISAENKNIKNLKVLDIGTGSGNIPITLVLGNPSWEGVGIDIQQEAIICANKNSIEYNINSKVKFELLDILTETPKYNAEIWVSNPPYIPITELPIIEDRVKKFEPEVALFVEDALIFYRRIINLFINDSNATQLWFECHQNYVEETAQLAIELNLDTKKIGDCSGNPRFLFIKK